MGDREQHHAWAPKWKDLSLSRGKNGSSRASTILWPFDSLEPASLAENECEGKAAASRLGVAWVSRIGQQIRLAQKHCPVQRDRN